MVRKGMFACMGLPEGLSQHVLSLTLSVLLEVLLTLLKGHTHSHFMDLFLTRDLFFF